MLRIAPVGMTMGPFIASYDGQRPRVISIEAQRPHVISSVVEKSGYRAILIVPGTDIEMRLMEISAFSGRKKTSPIQSQFRNPR